jgi:hypothetical protein
VFLKLILIFGQAKNCLGKWHWLLKCPLYIGVLTEVSPVVCGERELTLSYGKRAFLTGRRIRRTVRHLMSTRKRVSSLLSMITTLLMETTELSLANVKKKLSEEEHMKATAAGADVPVIEMTASALVISGLEIEQSQ